MLKKILIGLGIILLVIQLFRPEKNDSDEQPYAMSAKYQVPQELNNILKVSCNDCHSNKTVYPWYANVQPIAWYLDNHVDEGKEHLNFSTFTKLPIAVQNHKFEEMAEMVEKEEMPLHDYTYLGLHKEANLSEEQRNMIIDWAKAQMAYLKKTYPADSLVMKRR